MVRWCDLSERSYAQVSNWNQWSLNYLPFVLCPVHKQHKMITISSQHKMPKMGVFWKWQPAYKTQAIVVVFVVIYYYIMAVSNLHLLSGLACPWIRPPSVCCVTPPGCPCCGPVLAELSWCLASMTDRQHGICGLLPGPSLCGTDVPCSMFVRVLRWQNTGLLLCVHRPSKEALW